MSERKTDDFRPFEVALLSTCFSGLRRAKFGRGFSSSDKGLQLAGSDTSLSLSTYLHLLNTRTYTNGDVRPITHLDLTLPLALAAVGIGPTLVCWLECMRWNLVYLFPSVLPYADRIPAAYEPSCRAANT
jgi:hypothetical protein